jgi:hypothetical protein
VGCVLSEKTQRNGEYIHERQLWRDVSLEAEGNVSLKGNSSKCLAASRQHALNASRLRLEPAPTSSWVADLRVPDKRINLACLVRT